MTIPALDGRRIVLGVTGSIAAFKAADLASKLTQAGAQVDTILTESATRFITPLTFQALTGRRAHVDADMWSEEDHIPHVSLAEAADLVVIAPATADTIAKLAHGRADNLLTVTTLAARCPVVVAPAMDSGMYEHPATQDNIDTLAQRGVKVVGPERGRMASGLTGTGRMSEVPEIVGSVRQAIGASGPLGGRKLVVTAGGTQEPLDPVRVLANRSSGKQGYALAQAAIDRGAQVVLVSGPTALAAPYGVELVKVETAAQMAEAVEQSLDGADALIMAAAVADFEATSVESEKIKRADGIPELKLKPAIDILGSLGDRRPPVVIGFAAESDDLVENARAKLEDKRLDLIVANDILAEDAGFGADTNRVVVIGPGGEVDELSLMAKTEVAERVVNRLEELLD